jgi:hypothetical protein
METGQQRIYSRRGKTKERSIKAKPRPKLVPRRVAAKVKAHSVLTQVEMLS